MAMTMLGVVAGHDSMQELTSLLQTDPPSCAPATAKLSAFDKGTISASAWLLSFERDDHIPMIANVDRL